MGAVATTNDKTDFTFVRTFVIVISMRVRTRGAAFEKVRSIASTMPDVTEGTAWGVPAMKVRGTMFVCMASHKDVEPNTLAARLSFMDRDWLISQNPDVYYLKPHYVNYPCVLVRLDRVKVKDLRELLVNSREFVASLQNKRLRRRPR